MDVDVLLWGGSHRFEAYELEGKFFVNPGSATGAVAMGWGWEGGVGGVPSFCLMDVRCRELRFWRRGLLTLRFHIGAGGCFGAVCVSIEDGCEWCRECWCGESVVSEE